jgi:hypothetical protein
MPFLYLIIINHERRRQCRFPTPQLSIMRGDGSAVSLPQHHHLRRRQCRFPTSTSPFEETAVPFPYLTINRLNSLIEGAPRRANPLV